MSIMNYNDWFYKYHEYLTGTKGPKGYNDTKWKTINDRYSKLVDTMSTIQCYRKLYRISTVV